MDYVEYEKAQVYMCNNMLPRIEAMHQALAGLVKATKDYGSKISDNVTESTKQLVNAMNKELKNLAALLTIKVENICEKFNNMGKIEDEMSRIIGGIQ